MYGRRSQLAPSSLCDCVGICSHTERSKNEVINDLLFAAQKPGERRALNSPIPGKLRARILKVRLEGWYLEFVSSNVLGSRMGLFLLLLIIVAVRTRESRCGWHL